MAWETYELVLPSESNGGRFTRLRVGKLRVNRSLGLLALLVSLIGVVPSFVVSSVAYAAGDVNRATCAEFPGTEESPGFQSALPDCRAFEMVTPPYKGGQPAFGLNHKPPAIARDGSRLIGIDFAGFAGDGNLENKGLEVGAIYSFARSGSGWTTEALEPSAEEAARSEYRTASPELTTTLWEAINQQRPNEEVLERYAAGRSFALKTGTGRLVRIGPKEPAGANDPSENQKSQFAGASQELSHVFYYIFASPGDSWPGDSTDEFGPSLYEYRGVGQSEPTLVGVRNEGTLSGTPVNQQAELISQCGTRLGSAGTGSTYNSISTDGNRAYFSALECEEGAAGTGPEVTELYARTDQSSTTVISEPTAEQCEECKTPATRAVGRRPSIFEGGSADGNKAFFISEQELLPGAKAESLYEYDWNRPAGQHVVLVAPEVLGVSRVSEEGTRVYFVATAALQASPDLSLPAGGQEPTEGEPNLYTFDTATGDTQFVATLTFADETVWQHADESRRADTVGDGRYFVFTSSATLTSDDAAAVPQLFEYDAQRGVLVRISRGQTSAAFPDGFGDDGNVANANEAPKMPTTPQYQARTVPTDARSGASLATTGAAVFTSSDALAPGAVEGRENVYEYREDNVYLISAGDESAPLPTEESRLLGISESGRDIYFFTADALLPQDGDTQADWYDAREGGGFPGAALAPDCSGEACRQPFPGSPGLPLPGGSETASAGDNAPPATGKLETVKAKPLTRPQKLAKALETCRKDRARSKRASCEKSARKRFGSKPKAKAKSRKEGK